MQALKGNYAYAAQETYQMSLHLADLYFDGAKGLAEELAFLYHWDHCRGRHCRIGGYVRLTASDNGSDLCTVPGLEVQDDISHVYDESLISASRAMSQY